MGKCFRLLLKQHMAATLAALSIIFVIAVYVELLGWRIIRPDLSLPQAWSLDFVKGALRTAVGAALLGALPLLLGVIIPPTRTFSVAHPVLIWAVGAVIFLLAILFLTISGLQ